ncbi:MAG: hdig [uncultured bacterium]|nr:MAG: hdig [uncultured bacterium]
MRLPTEADCRSLYSVYHSPANIQDHMRRVAAISVLIAQWSGANAALVQAAAWLHDLVRIKEQWSYLPATISTPLPHAEINYLLLREQWPEVAQVIRTHSLMTILQEQPFSRLEEKIVYYADKRVNHATIVTLTERLTLGNERWQVTSTNDRRHELMPKLQQLEIELFTNAPFPPHELKTHLQTQP